MTDLSHPAGLGADWSGNAGLARFTARLDRAIPAKVRNTALALFFSSFFLLQISQHALWRDELNAWGIALASRTLPDLFAHMHYEGHPGLWHLLLWIASQASTSPTCLKVLHAGIGVAIIGMIAVRSPFTALEKLLLLLSYFVLFEYTVISRNYGVGFLLALVFCARRASHPEQTGRNIVLLGLMANTNVFAMALSAGLALEYGWHFVQARRGAGRPWLFAALRPVAVYAAFVLLSVATFWPAHDISWRTTGRPLDEPMLIRLITATIDQLSAVFPLDLQAFWSPGRDFAPPEDEWARIGTLAAAPLLVLLVIRPLWRQPRLILIPAVTLLGSIALEFLVYGSIRHWGVNFAAVVAALWLGRARATPDDVRWSLPLLAINALAGVIFTWMHWGVPFSNAGATAAWLQAHGRAGAAIVGTPDTHVAAVAELLGRPAYFLDCGCSDTYLKFHNRRDAFRRANLIDAIAAAPLPHAAAPPGVFLDIRPLTAAQVADLGRRGITVGLEAAMTGALQENFYIYRIARAGQAAADPGTAERPDLTRSDPVAQP